MRLGSAPSLLPVSLHVPHLFTKPRHDSRQIMDAITTLFQLWSSEVVEGALPTPPVNEEATSGSTAYCVVA